MATIYEILTDLGVKCTYSHTIEATSAQQKNNTLWGVKKILEYYGVKVTAVKYEDKSLEEVSYPFVCITSEGFVAITKPMEDESAFLEEWNGYALLCDVSQAKEPQYLRNFLKEKITENLTRFLWISLSVAAAIFLYEPFSIARLLLVLSNAFGLYFSYRSAVKECAGTCSVVTESPAGNILGYSLSVIGIGYFSVSLIPTLFIPSWLPVWNWIAAIALIMPLWSISHQAFVLHAWCKNCLLVQLMVILSAATVIFTGSFSIDSSNVQPLIGLPALYLLSVHLLKIAFDHYKSVKNPPMDSTVLRLMNNPAIREEILHSGKEADTSHIPDLWVINPEGKEELFVAISLGCAHCKDLFFKIYKAVKKGELKDYRIKIVISQNTHDKKVIEVLASAALHQGADKAMQLLAQWYEDGNPKSFFRSAGKNHSMDGVGEILATFSKEVAPLNINGLPFVSLNGYEITGTLFWAKVELER